MKVLARASALVLALAAHAAQAQEPVVIRVLDRADFVLGNSRVPPPDDAPWKPVSLPDNWYLSHPGETQVGWYRFTYDLTPEQARIPHSIYLMRNSARRIDFWFNGFRHSANVAYGDPGARNWSPPMINTVSAYCAACGFATLLRIDHAANMPITVVLPVPVAILSA